VNLSTEDNEGLIIRTKRVSIYLTAPLEDYHGTIISFDGYPKATLDSKLLNEGWNTFIIEDKG